MKSPADIRKEWSQEHEACWLCGTTQCLETHEIVRRSQARMEDFHPANLFRACGEFANRCHADRLANLTVAPYASQLAFKLLHDPDHYSLQKFLEILGRGPEAVTAQEVELCFRTLMMVDLEIP